MAQNKITKAIQEAGGEVFIVGGAVRDEMLGIESKDIDFLIRFLTYNEIKEAISHLGKVFDQEIGGKVSTLKAVIDGEEFDIAIPRTGEKSTGVGHGDFEITLDPHAPIESDLSRRDFTFNALAKNEDGTIVDKFGGLQDIEDRVVRAVGNPVERFAEDPLRMLRALQFACRLGFEIEGATAEAIRSMKHLLLSISNERIFMEFEKAWTKGKGKSDNLKLIRLLANLGIGEKLFGEHFDPMAISLEGNDEERVIGSFVAFFLNGGDVERIRPTNHMESHLNVAKAAVSNQPQIWKWAKKHQLPILTQVFHKIEMPHVVSKFEHASQMPMIPKELALSGRELMDLGLEGKEIGEAQQSLISAVFSGLISNEKEELTKWIKTS